VSPALTGDDLRSAKLLIVDDEPANVRLLERLLAQAGYADIRSTTDPREASTLYAAIWPDLVLLDLRMPHMDGYAVMEQLRLLTPAGAYVPILVLTADLAGETTRRALLAGAQDFLTKPFDHHEVVLRIRNLLRTRFLHVELARQNELLEERVRERTQRLLQMEKLSAMGQLLAGVAHELNNPLAVVLGQAQLLQHARPQGDVSGRAEKIARAAERCVRIVRNFLALARERPPERRKVDLNAVIKEALELVGYELRSDGVELRLDLAPALPALWADPHQLHQVVVNLLTNAHYAMRQSAAPRVLTLSTESGVEGARVRFTVTDTGPGIPPELQARIFEPFFTTKPTGEGTGLGLSFSRGLVESHGGSMSLKSPPGGGATFQVELPVVTPPVDAPRSAPRPAVTPPAITRVLVVDDEPDVVGFLVDLLRIEGHDVDTAANGAEALDKISQRRYHAVLSDTRMPILDGIGFYREIQRRHPELQGHVAFMTGDTLSPEKREFLDRTGAPSLMKPFSLDEVQRVIQRLVES
jgi:signal transduction histidine kinase